VLLGFGVSLTLGKAEVYHLNNVLVLRQPNEEIVGFGVTVDEVVCVNLLQPLQHLLCQHEHGLQVEFTRTEGKQLLQ